MSLSFADSLADLHLADERAEMAGNTGAAVVMMAVEKLREDPDQPRDDLDTPEAQEKLAEMAETVRRRGVLQPITVRPMDPMTGIYTIRFGHRRYRASKIAGLAAVPIVIREDDGDEIEQITDQVLENEQRAPLTTGQMARHVGKMLAAGLKPGEIATRLGKSNSEISHLIAVADLPPVLAPLASVMGARTLAELKKAHELDAQATAAFLEQHGADAITQVSARALAQALKSPARAVEAPAAPPLPPVSVTSSAPAPVSPPVVAQEPKDEREAPSAPPKASEPSAGKKTGSVVKFPASAPSAGVFAQAKDAAPADGDGDPALEALARLFRIAKSDTGQAGRVARFLMAWWNASEYGGFDVVDLFNVDPAIGQDIVTVMGFIVEQNEVIYFDQLGFADEIEAVLRQWKPEAFNG